MKTIRPGSPATVEKRRKQSVFLPILEKILALVYRVIRSGSAAAVSRPLEPVG